MQFLHAILLGVLQGIAEWLPISSEGQTMLSMIGWMDISPGTALSYSIFLHIGTMSAVLVKFRHEFIEMARSIDSTMTRTLVVSSFCTGITGLPLYFLLKESFTGGREATLLIGGMLIATGLLLRMRGSGSRGVEDMTIADMAILGLAQGFSILPGVSRSGTTLAVLLMRNLNQSSALTISFLISVPAVMGAIVLDHTIPTLPIGIAASMLAASFLVGYLTMDLLIAFSKRVDFSRFCIALGLLTLALVALL